MPAIISLAVGAVIGAGGNRYVISNHLDLNSLHSKNREMGNCEVIQIRDITPVSKLNSEEQERHAEISLMEEAAWNEAEGWHGKLRSLISDTHKAKDKVKSVADEVGVHLATVYRKLDRLERDWDIVFSR